ncbi:unnamed protein product [Staurois parvus]|uniref:Uncharacterized protein n=1 Tax=Staurois parvus TaxID=386267 RepID=A0ABN9FRX0_9NEOB|nr:unnamed protein product [Staurois parvus]
MAVLLSEHNSSVMSRGGLTIWKLGPGISRGPHEMPLVPFS